MKLSKRVDWLEKEARSAMHSRNRLKAVLMDTATCAHAREIVEEVVSSVRDELHCRMDALGRLQNTDRKELNAAIPAPEYIRKLAREEAEKVLAGAVDPPWQPSVEQINAWYGQEFISVELLAGWLERQRDVADGLRRTQEDGRLRACYLGEWTAINRIIKFLDNA